MSSLKHALKSYLDKIYEIFMKGDAREESYYTLLEDLINEYAKISGKNIEVRILPKKTEGGNPDFRIWGNSQEIIGYIEAKSPTTKSLDEMEQTEQLKRYLENFPNLTLTNFLEFRLYRNGKLIGSTFICRQDTLARLSLKPPLENEDKFFNLLEKFFSFSYPRDYSAETLAEELAKRTHFLKDIISMEFESEKTKEIHPLHDFYDTFKKYLINGLKEDEFVDLFSQTITYGLFAARMRSDSSFNRTHAYEKIPKTIGILRELFKFISIAEDLPKQMEWTIDDIANILAVVDVKGIFENYYHSGQGEDPVVYFYETFLSTYNPMEREKRGVYYTPMSVVKYIVNSVNEILKDRLGIENGLQDKRVTVLDPAAGTLSFITESIKLAISEYKGKFGAGGKTKFIQEHIINDFYAFELMVAPYAIGHIKLSFILEEEGYKLKEDERPKFYLTNTLDMNAVEQASIPLLREISEESHLAEKVKKEIPILVVMGNPPYSGISANINEWTEKLLKEDIDGLQSYYKVDNEPLNEKNPKWLQDDYVKFIRFAQWKINQIGEGIIGFITNHSYLDNPTFRGMRQSLMKTFNEIYILDLHGNSLKKEKAPDGGKDENVFDIRQGVSIVLFVKKKGETSSKVFHSEIWGLRDYKYDFLQNHSFRNTTWKEIYPTSPYYFFVPRKEEGRELYESWHKVNEIFKVSSVGIVTARDEFVTDDDKNILLSRIRMFRDSKLSDEELHMYFGISKKKGWSIRKAWNSLQNLTDLELENSIKTILYRPFNQKFLFYYDDLIERSRKEVMSHMLAGENLGLITTRQVSEGVFRHALVSNFIIESCYVSNKTKEIGYVFSLYLYPSQLKPSRNEMFKTTETTNKDRIPNINEEFFEMLTKL
ncbi:MAG: N-6 DNA methylase, partial [Candidatus Brockarchaeota archaeon]|nr:N-6 DNA methylase [Candidatus Brockarchaeota archaeon]